jgi:hypothetical protein
VALAIAFTSRSLPQQWVATGNKLMKLNSHKPGASLPLRLQSQNWFSKLENSIVEQKLQASTWVQLRERPSPYSYDEALLLCQHSDTEWIVWIPDHGEMVLHRSQIGKAC